MKRWFVGSVSCTRSRTVPIKENRSPALISAMLAGAAWLTANAPLMAQKAGSAASANDPILTAMRQELDREREQILLPGMQRPYFMEYRLEDIHNWSSVANYGSVTNESENHQRIVRVEVRVGDYTSDSSSARGDGSLALAPEENDTDALKYALWSATDEAYKNALRAYATKQAALKSFQNPPNANDFAPAKPVDHVEPLAELKLDRAAWKRRIADASGLFRSDSSVKSFSADVQSSTANVTALAVNRYTVNTDGTALRRGYTAYLDGFAVAGQAPDGMQLGSSSSQTAVSAEGLDSEAALKARALRHLGNLDALRHAPVVEAEDYHGPVLFSGDAAADVFNRLFVPNIEADRPDMGTSARTQGAYQSSFKSAVLPPFLSVVDDPLERSFAGRTLVGSYQVDDQGTPVQPVTVVEKGRLVSYLVGREPVKDFPASNGHGRAALGQAPHSKAGVVRVESSQKLTDGEMRAKLLALAKEQGRDVYEVESLSGELTPRMLYRVSSDGKRTLVRGAVFDELDQRSLRSEIVAAGGTPWVEQTIGPVPETTIAPELLFADIAVKRATQEQNKLPYYAPPGQ